MLKRLPLPKSENIIILAIILSGMGLLESCKAERLRTTLSGSPLTAGFVDSNQADVMTWNTRQSLGNVVHLQW
eukprot:138993-Amphidinium_carterae.1